METSNNDDWLKQLSNSITTLEQLEKELDLTEEEKLTIDKKLPLRITPYYLNLIKNDHLNILRKTVIPTISELEINEEESNDPLCEEEYKKTECLIHKYPDRCLFLVTNFCSTNCRYCTRSRIIESEGNYTTNEWEDAIHYIEEHDEIRDVLISGGDPLTLSDKRLDYLLFRLHSIEHVEILRIGTKVPVVLPMRITKNLIKILKNYQPLYINIHFTHPLEITHECKDACNMLADAGIVLGSQTVLLKGINNDSEVIKNLMQKLLTIRVKPYYLYMVDKIFGSEHFRTSIDDGEKIINSLRWHTTGMAIPTLILDTPKGKRAIK